MSAFADSALETTGAPHLGDKGFLQMPPPWVWLVFALSMAIFSMSMLTFREGRRFVSRPLQPSEVRIVLAACALWQRGPDQEAGRDAEKVRALLREGELLAMADSSFGRPEERGTFGYTDEHGRILLNPKLCFANHRMHGSRTPESADVVATMSTLYHESRHLFHLAAEPEAYEGEWRFVRRNQTWAVQSQQSELTRVLEDWEKEVPCRVELYLGRSTLVEMKARIDGPAMAARLD